MMQLSMLWQLIQQSKYLILKDKYKGTELSPLINMNMCTAVCANIECL